MQKAGNLFLLALTQTRNYLMPAPFDFETEIRVGEERYPVRVTLDGRLRKSARWSLREAVVMLRVPRSMNRAEIDQVIERIQGKILRNRKRKQTLGDDFLQARAEAMNKLYFKGELAWTSIRWVDNMEQRLGSCTNGGSTDGEIRISSRIRNWPDYVVDYVVAHELAHRRYPNHNSDYWNYLAAYPYVEKAHGFIEGITFNPNDGSSSGVDF
jgi:predicted metal-dependent hydrolase